MAGGYKKYKLNKNSMPVAADSPAMIDLPLKDGQLDFVRWDVKVNGAKPNKADTIVLFPTCELFALGESWCKFDVEDIIEMNEFYGDAFKDGFIEQFFAQSFRTLITEREATSMNPQLLGEPYMSLYVAAGATNPSVKQYYQAEGHTDAQEHLMRTEPARANNSLIYYAKTKIDMLSSGAEPTDYTYNLGGDAIRSFNFKGSNISRIVMFIDGQEDQDFKSLEHLNSILSSKGFFPQADIWHINFEVLAGSISGLLDPNYGGLKRDISFEIYTTDETRIDLLVEQYNKPKVIG